MTTNRETTPPTPNAGEWITHDGRPNPVPGQMVEAKSSSGTWTALSDNMAWNPYGDVADIIAYRLATPSPAAQDDPAKGLEVVDLLVNAFDRDEGEPDYKDFLRRCREVASQLTDLATAERQIAELRSRVAELDAAKWEVKHVDTMNDMVSMGTARDAAEARALASEADAARMREVVQTAVKILANEAVSEPLRVFGALNCLDAALTQRGA